MKKLPALLAVALFAVTLSAAAAGPLPELKAYKGPALDMTGAVESVAYYESDEFPIACWVPSMYDLDKFAKRGIKIAWFNQRLNPKEKPVSEYVAKAHAAGMKMWRYPAEYMDPPLDPSFDAKDPTLVAYSLLDEPVLHKKGPEDMLEQHKAFKEVNPKFKTILNFEGQHIVMPNPSPAVVEKYTAYMNACDIACVDWYVKNANADRYPLSHLWTAVERLGVWGKTKPVGAFIECSNQKISPLGREPTVGEMRAEVVGSLIHGARMIAWFPQVPGKKENKGKYFGTGNDGTPPELEAEQVKINKQLQALAPVLLAKGARLTTMKEPMLGAVRYYKGQTYLIVLNNDADDKVEFNGETIEPYDWRVYTAGAAPAEKR